MARQRRVIRSDYSQLNPSQNLYLPKPFSLFLFSFCVNKFHSKLKSLALPHP